MSEREQMSKNNPVSVDLARRVLVTATSSHSVKRQNPDGSWSQAKPIPGYGWYGIQQRWITCRHCWHHEWNSDDLFCCHCALSSERASIVLLAWISFGVACAILWALHFLL